MAFKIFKFEIIKIYYTLIFLNHYLFEESLVSLDFKN